MRHSISVHIFPLFILIIFTLYSIPYIYIQSALYCRIRIFISSASSIYIDYSFFYQRRRYLPDKFREYFNGRGIRINILFLQVFILPSREGRGGRFAKRLERALNEPTRIPSGSCTIRDIDIGPFPRGSAIVLLCGRRNSVSRIGTVSSARCSLDTLPAPAGKKTSLNIRENK